MNLLTTFFLISVLFPSGPGRACEQHAKAHAPSAAALPDQSIYNLDSTWTDQNGREVRFSELAGHPRIIAMVFTKCPSACPLIVQDIKTVRSRLTPEQQENLQVSLFSFDEQETKDTLSSFATKYKLDAKSWSVLRASKTSVAELAGVLSIHYKRLPSGEFVHANALFLVDEQGTIIAKSEGLGSAQKDFTEAVERAGRTLKTR